MGSQGSPKDPWDTTGGNEERLPLPHPPTTSFLPGKELSVFVTTRSGSRSVDENQGVRVPEVWGPSRGTFWRSNTPPRTWPRDERSVTKVYCTGSTEQGPGLDMYVLVSSHTCRVLTECESSGTGSTSQDVYTCPRERPPF